jgi:DedD protein
MAEKEPGETILDESSDAPDSPLLIKKRARRRLVGAIALALAAVIVLPLVMEHEPAPAGPEIQIQIPSQQQTGLVGKPPVAKEPKPSAAASNVTNATPPATTATAALPTPVQAPAAELSAAVKPAPTTPVAEKPAAPPVVSKASDKARAESALAGDDVAEAAKSKAAGKAEGWVVQLGAYQSAGNVAVLMAKLKEMRVPAYTEKFDSPQGPRTRVRAGPFKDKEAALKAQTRVKIIGVTGPVSPVAADS